MFTQRRKQETLMSVKKQVKRITVCLATLSVMFEKQCYLAKLSNIFVGGTNKVFHTTAFANTSKTETKNAKCRMD